MRNERRRILNDKRLLYLLLFFAAALILVLALGALGTIRRNWESRELRQRLEQVNRDLRTAIDSQREAAERASRLQAELQGITEYARSLEAGTRRAEARAGNLADYLDGIADRSGELADGINRASDGLEESRILLDELGTLVRGLPGGGGRENQKP